MAFRKGENPNHLKRGAGITVDPIRDLKAIVRIKEGLLERKQYWNYCLFTFGINTAWRGNELLSIKVGDVRYRKPNKGLKLEQSKTGYYRYPPSLPPSLHPHLEAEFEELIAKVTPSDDLFSMAKAMLEELWARRAKSLK